MLAETITERASKSLIRPALCIHPDDTVAVALRDLAAGETVEGVLLSEPIPHGHKFALRPIADGARVLKFGEAIGAATQDIAPGQHVHTHNLRTRLRESEDYIFTPMAERARPMPSRQSFSGYLRPDGRVGTRNEVWVLCTVGCVAMTAQRLAMRADMQFGERCDGVHAFTHPFGCSQTGGDLETTRRLLAALVNHPNAGGVLVVGLGCENNQGAAMLADVPEDRRARVRFFNAQDSADEFEEGLAHLDALTQIAAGDARSEQPLSKLVVGLKCGGSDGLSGLTANALLGRVSDRVCDAGGAVVLTEIPEIFGAEQALLHRAASRDVFDRTVALVNGFKQYYVDHGENVYENPSPGNKAGGITTLEEKSLGAVQKGGQAVVTDVLDYACPVRVPGLSLLRGPGNDAVSATNLVASGATVVLFTTGRGTPLGFPVPTLKVASNSELAARKANWIDFDAGVLTSATDRDAVTDDFMARILSIASGDAKARNEINDQREIAIWKTGVTL